MVQHQPEFSTRQTRHREGLKIETFRWAVCLFPLVYHHHSFATKEEKETMPVPE